MSEQTMPLREQVAREAANRLHSQYPGEYLPWDDMNEGARAVQYRFVDAALAVMAAQPRPEMAEIERQVRIYGTDVALAWLEHLADGDNERRDHRNHDAATALLALIERALAVPADHVVVSVDDLRTAIAGLELTRDGNLATWRPERSDAVLRLRALLPERGDE